MELRRDVQLVKMNNRWPLFLPPHRAARAEWTSGWEVERLDATFDAICMNDVVFDIGAEEGDMSGLYASWGARVVLIEPNPLVTPNQRLIFEANKLKPYGVFTGFCAERTDLAGQHIKDLLFMHERWPPAAYGPVIGDHGFSRIEERPDIPRITVDELCQALETFPNVITIDVEGAEWFVLDGAQRTLRYARPHVFVSVHPDFLRAHYNQEPAIVFNLLDACGYTYRELAVDHEVHIHAVPK